MFFYKKYTKFTTQTPFNLQVPQYIKLQCWSSKAIKVSAQSECMCQIEIWGLLEIRPAECKLFQGGLYIKSSNMAKFLEAHICKKWNWKVNYDNSPVLYQVSPSIYNTHSIHHCTCYTNPCIILLIRFQLSLEW